VFFFRSGSIQTRLQQSLIVCSSMIKPYTFSLVLLFCLSCFSMYVRERLTHHEVFMFRLELKHFVFAYYSFFLIHLELKRQIRSYTPVVSPKTIPVSRPKRRKNHTLWGDKYLYGLYKGVTFSPRSLGGISYQLVPHCKTKKIYIIIIIKGGKRNPLPSYLLKGCLYL